MTTNVVPLMIEGVPLMIGQVLLTTSVIPWMTGEVLYDR